MKDKSLILLLGLVGLAAILYFAMKKNPTVQYQTQYQPELLPEPPIRLQNNNGAEGRTLYQNEERIQVVRDADGHINEFVIHRRVTADG
jgi:hypothetical protein